MPQYYAFCHQYKHKQTHAPRDDNDEPILEFQAQLDSVQLITTVPRDLGYASMNGTTLASENSNKWGSGEDLLCINFAQFYQMLVRITEIVYRDLFAKDSTVAMNKLLQVGHVWKLI